MPVTTPDASTDAMPAVPPDQIPPIVASASDVVLPAHTEKTPVIGNGIPFTVMLVVAFPQVVA